MHSLDPREQAALDIARTSGVIPSLTYPLLSATTGFGTLLAADHPGRVYGMILFTSLTGAVRYLASRGVVRYSGARRMSYYRVTLAMVLLNVLCWSVYLCAAVSEYGAGWTGLMVLMTTVGLVAGASSTLSPHYPTFVLHMVVSLVPATAILLLSPGSEEIASGVTILAYGLFMGVIGRQHNLRYVGFHRAVAELSEARVAAEQASRAKTVFLATMSHEIRTPLNAIRGLTQLLLDSPVSEQQLSWLQAVDESGSGLLSLLTDLLDLSKIEAGQLSVHPEPFALRPLLEGMRQLMEPLARTKGLELCVECADDVPLAVISDPLRIRQILLNLLGNAVKFSARGTVRLVVRNGPRQTLEFGVLDEGIGIDAEALSRMFLPFSQGDSGTTRQYGGTGLGLAISRQLCSLLGGELWLCSIAGCAGEVPPDWPASRRDRGTEFWLRVPCRPADLQGAHPPPLAEVAATRRILVAEDNRVNQLVIQQTLQNMGHEVVLVRTGREALAAWQQGQFNLLLMDLQMPDMDGLEATRQIRQQSHGAQPWIVALTANAFSDDRERCLAAGMNDYLSKPVGRAELEAALSRAPLTGGGSSNALQTTTGSVPSRASSPGDA